MVVHDTGVSNLTHHEITLYPNITVCPENAMRLIRKTICLRLLPPTGKKQKILLGLMAEARDVFNKTAILLPSYGDNYGKIKSNYEFFQKLQSGGELSARCSNEMVAKAIENWETEKAQGSSSIPKMTEEPHLLRLHYQDYDFIHSSDGERYYLKLSCFKKNPYKRGFLIPLWGGEYHSQWAKKLQSPSMMSRTGAKKKLHKSRKGSAELIYKDGDLWIHVVWNDEAPPVYVPTLYLGIDLGMNTLVAAALIERKKNDFIVKKHWLLGNDWFRWRKRANLYKRIRQSKGLSTDPLRGVINRKKTTLLKQFAHQIVYAAKANNAAIQMENLHQFRKVRDWPFYAFRETVRYMCKALGVPFRKVRFSKTSMTCPKCGYVDEKNRAKRLFKCLKCGFDWNSDLVAAVNIAKATPPKRKFIKHKKIAKGRPKVLALAQAEATLGIQIKPRHTARGQPSPSRGDVPASPLVEMSGHFLGDGIDGN